MDHESSVRRLPACGSLDSDHLADRHPPPLRRGPLYRRFGDQHLILGGLGLALASVFPMGIIWYTNLVAHDNDGLAIMILFMMIGDVLGPSLVGYVVSQTSIHAVPYVVTGLCVATLAAFGSIRRFHTVDVRPAP